MNLTSRRGNMVLEAALWIPITTLLLVGMAQIGRVTYTYYTLRKTVYSIAQYVSSQQAVDFCNPADPAIAAAINFGLTGTTDNTGTALVNGLTSDMILVAAETFDSATQTLSSWSSASCVDGAGGAVPQFITVSIPEGYGISIRIPRVPLTPILLKPVAKVPYGG